VSWRGLVVGLVAVLLASCQAVDRAQREIAQRGVEAYTRALETQDRDARMAAFAEAQRFFASAAKQGGAPDLYVNLGNAALGAGDLGAAVLAYRRALTLDPDHPRALQNLDHARGQLPVWVPRFESVSVLDSFFFWQRSLSRPERWFASGCALLLAAVLLAWSIATRQVIFRNLAWAPGVAWVVILGSLLFDPAAEAEDDAVITAAEVEARAADSAVAPVLFSAPLPAGTEARILEDRPPWRRIRLANGRDVWVAATSVTLVTPRDGAPATSIE